MADPEDMTLEELEKALDQGGLPQPEPIEPEASEEPAEPTPAPVETEAAPAQEAPAEPKAEEVTDQDILEARLAEYESRSKHFEQVAGKHAGEVGFLKQQLAELRQRLMATQASEDAGLYQPEPSQRPEPTPAPKSDAVASWAVAQAAQQAVAEFVGTHPDYPTIKDDIAAYLQQTGYDAAPILAAQDPLFAARETKRMLEESYWHIRAQKDAARKAELTTKRAEQKAAQVAAKQAASPSGSGATPPPKPKEKSVSDMSLDELEAAMRKETRGLW